MTNSISEQAAQINNNDLTLEQIMAGISKYWRFIRRQWLKILGVAIIFGGLGLFYAVNKPVSYSAKLTFALEEDKGMEGGLAGAIGLANSLGFDMGSNAGGAFSGMNLLELMKSRLVVEKALLTPINVDNKIISLADFYVKIHKLDKDWGDREVLRKLTFPPLSDRSKFNYYQDSIILEIYHYITNVRKEVTVGQKDKKVGIITLEVKSKNEKFAKYFAESLAKEVSDFYIDTKSKRSRMNVQILEHQSDSIRRELNAAITGVAVSNDNTFNINPAMMLPKTSGIKKQIDVQTNTAILTQLVANLEIARVSLRKETPLIQIIDSPIFPLQKDKLGKKMALALGAIAGGILSVLYFVLLFWYKERK
jgi:uncharacterized protein involved in exopolysaccharide biosynthesis